MTLAAGLHSIGNVPCLQVDAPRSAVPRVQIAAGGSAAAPRPAVPRAELAAGVMGALGAGGMSRGHARYPGLTKCRVIDYCRVATAL